MTKARGSLRIRSSGSGYVTSPAGGVQALLPALNFVCAERAVKSRKVSGPARNTGIGW
jgi:hypothetical protein